MAGTQGFTPSQSPQAVMDPRSEAITELAKLHWSQHKIARAVGLSQPGISKILRHYSGAPPPEPLREIDTVTATEGDNFKAANPISATDTPGGNGAPERAGGEAPGRCGRVSVCQGRLWITRSGITFCETCGPKPHGGWFERWVSE